MSIESSPTCGDGAHARRRHADVARLERHERFVLDRSAQRRERPLVADVLQAQVAVGAIEEVDRTLVGAEHLHQESGAVGAGARRTTARRARRARTARARRGVNALDASAVAAPRPAVGRRLGRPKASSTATPTVAPIATTRKISAGRPPTRTRCGPARRWRGSPCRPGATAGRRTGRGSRTTT